VIGKEERKKEREDMIDQNQRKQEDAVYLIVGSAIRRHRQQAGISQPELAEKLGLNRSSISNIEAGRQRLMLHTLCEIADIFAVPVATFFEER
jgi:DNA-binding XRE family transcriptional regulator